MSRVANTPITIPEGVEIRQEAGSVHTKGAKGELSFDLPAGTEVEIDDGEARARAAGGRSRNRAMAGTVRAILANQVQGVSEGVERKLELVGVGYRAQAQGSKLSLSLGLSHPVEYELPEGVSVETPTQTEIVLKGIDHQAVGQAAAKIRGFRPPEPYKGKGIRYSDERVLQKEAKKK